MASSIWVAVKDIIAQASHYIVGSATTSGIRLDVSGGTFRVREGDNSADGPMSAARGDFSGPVVTTDSFSLTAGGTVSWNGRNRLKSNANGNTQVTNNDSSNTYDITLADWGTTLSAESNSVANNGVLFLGSSPVGLLHINLGTDARAALFELEGSNNATALAYGSASFFTVTKDTASRVNVYYDAAGASGAGYYLQNLRGGSRSVRAMLVGG